MHNTYDPTNMLGIHKNQIKYNILVQRTLLFNRLKYNTEYTYMSQSI